MDREERIRRCQPCTACGVAVGEKRHRNKGGGYTCQACFDRQERIDTLILRPPDPAKVAAGQCSSCGSALPRAGNGRPKQFCRACLKRRQRVQSKRSARNSDPVKMALYQERYRAKHPQRQSRRKRNARRMERIAYVPPLPIAPCLDCGGELRRKSKNGPPPVRCSQCSQARSRQLAQERRRERYATDPAYRERKAARDRTRREQKRLRRENLIRLIIEQEGRCTLCGEVLPREPEHIHIDHIESKSGGGSDTANNVQALCAGCNLSKGGKHPLTFAREQGRLL